MKMCFPQIGSFLFKKIMYIKKFQSLLCLLIFFLGLRFDRCVIFADLWNFNIYQFENWPSMI